MATSLRVVEAPEELDIVAALINELEHHCRRQPLKREALELALTIVNGGDSAYVAARSLELIQSIAKRLSSPLRVFFRLRSIATPQ